MSNVIEEFEDEFEDDEDIDEGKFLTFTVGDESYGLEIIYVTEILGIQKITEVPELPEYVRGIVSLRGQIIPVIDIRLKFKKPFREYDEKTCIIVVEIQDISVGIIVDAVLEVVTIQTEEIVPPPDINEGYGRKYIRGIGVISNEVKLLLDCNKLLNNDEIQDLEQQRIDM
ncbi:chemotaxis protein CheW [Acetobacterium paludosum]|uniref:Chemotaxis protein CheW n=1 Tax=Acetobacterium paludosum TaxID=52693 RepID=A0A923I4I2_9FIRM|nr:chemotaxis protein CheW [Acetobacterium paludosum]MBC3889783.1 chemotaxis protein CheW [Acetobacterium paludosum]